MNDTTIVAEAPTQEVQAVKNLILNHLDEIDKVKEQIKSAREMVTSALENDESFRNAKEAEGEKKRERQEIEAKIKDANPTPVAKLDELKEQLKDLQTALGDYLAEFVRRTGKMEITKHDGTELKIVRRYKTVSPGQQKLF